MHFFTYIVPASFTKVMQDYQRIISLFKKSEYSLMCKINAHGSFHLCNFIFLQRNKIYVTQIVVFNSDSPANLKMSK